MQISVAFTLSPLQDDVDRFGKNFKHKKTSGLTVKEKVCREYDVIIAELLLEVKSTFEVIGQGLIHMEL